MFLVFTFLTIVALTDILHSPIVMIIHGIALLDFVGRALFNVFKWVKKKLSQKGGEE